MRQTKESFAARFEADGGGYVFRARPDAPGFRLSAAERDFLVERFGRRFLWGTLAFTAVLLFAVVGIIFLFIDESRLVIEVATYATVAVLSGGFVAWVIWIWNEPARHFRGRSPEAAGLSKSEASRKAWESVTWGRLGLVAGAGVVFAVIGYQNGGSLIYLLAAGVFGTIAAVQAFRKWRFSRRAP